MTTLMSDLSKDIPVRSFLCYTKLWLALKHTSNYGLTVSIQKRLGNFSVIIYMWLPDHDIGRRYVMLAFCD